LDWFVWSAGLTGLSLCGLSASHHALVLPEALSRWHPSTSEDSSTVQQQGPRASILPIHAGRRGDAIRLHLMRGAQTKQPCKTYKRILVKATRPATEPSSTPSSTTPHPSWCAPSSTRSPLTRQTSSPPLTLIMTNKNKKNNRVSITQHHRNRIIITVNVMRSDKCFVSCPPPYRPLSLRPPRLTHLVYSDRRPCHRAFRDAAAKFPRPSIDRDHLQILLAEKRCCCFLQQEKKLMLYTYNIFALLSF
jgi:hypothetical protein